jgi:NAD+ synthase (glutamine-hydrolysing)
VVAVSNPATKADSSSMMLSICTAQLNFVVGDMPGNAQKIIAARMKPTRRARVCC